MDQEVPEPGNTVLDVQELLDRCLGSLELAQRVLGKFQERIDADLAELEQAVLTGDTDLIARVAHRIKGASANVAAHGLRDQAAAMEASARQCCLAGIASQLDRLRHERSRLSGCFVHLRTPAAS